MPYNREGEELRLQRQENKETGRRATGIFAAYRNPVHLRQDRADRGEQEEVVPPLPQGDGGETEIEQRDVAEEEEWIICPAREQRRRKKSA